MKFISRKNLRSLGPMVFILSLFFGGCAPAVDHLQSLMPEALQSQHTTEFVMVSHPSLRLFWEIDDAGSMSGSYIIEIKNDSISGQPIQFQPAQSEELLKTDLVFQDFPEIAPITYEVFWKTIERHLKGKEHMQLRPYSGNGKVNEIKKIKELESRIKNSPETLKYNIPAPNSESKPDWYLVLEVNRIGILKQGNKVGSGNLSSALAGLATHLIAKKTWSAYFAGSLYIADAQNNQLLWRCHIEATEKMEGKFDEVLDFKNGKFIKALIDGIATAASKGTANIIANQCLEKGEELLNYKLPASDLEPFIKKISPMNKEQSK